MRAHRAARGGATRETGDGTFRVSVGLEDANDLIADLDQTVAG